MVHSQNSIVSSTSSLNFPFSSCPNGNPGCCFPGRLLHWIPGPGGEGGVLLASRRSPSERRPVSLTYARFTVAVILDPQITPLLSLKILVPGSLLLFPGPASWECELCCLIGTHTSKGPARGLMLRYHCLEILNFE